jgi:tetratricopeptide (TPR) repeat protein
MNKTQLILLSTTVALFFIMYFGCETKARNIKDQETSRSFNMEVTSIDNLLIQAKKSLNKNQLTTIETMTEEIQKDTSELVAGLQMLAKQWFEYDNPVISGYYAEEIANKTNTADAWSIAGTSYIYGLKSVQDEKARAFSKQHAIRAIEKAITMEPSNISHKINMALCYVESPDKENPMKGILMLRELNTKHPENVQVLNQLASLAIKTRQFDKAIQRLNEALKLEPDNQTAICLIAQAYDEAGDKTNAASFAKKCKN